MSLKVAYPTALPDRVDRRTQPTRRESGQVALGSRQEKESKETTTNKKDNEYKRKSRSPPGRAPPPSQAHRRRAAGAARADVWFDRCRGPTTLSSGLSLPTPPFGPATTTGKGGGGSSCRWVNEPAGHDEAEAEAVNGSLPPVRVRCGSPPTSTAASALALINIISSKKRCDVARVTRVYPSTGPSVSKNVA